MIKINIKNGLAEIYTPYNSTFVRKIKRIGSAKWDFDNKCWTVPVEVIDIVREIMVEVYGYSDITENETISLKITFVEEVSEYCSDIVMFGKILAHATGRDSGAKVGDDVAYSKGLATSGGSAKNWLSIVKEESVVILTNVNKNIYEKECSDLKEKYNITVEIIDTGVNKQQLIEEKERLLKRITEIDKILKTQE